MLELFSSGILSLWLDATGVSSSLPSVNQYALDGTPWIVLLSNPDPKAQTTTQQYLQGLATRGLELQQQGVWIQSGPNLLSNHQGTTPLPAASLTKVATSLASLKTWGPDHRFETLVSATGPVENGTLRGDLVVQGGADPFFVWEEAIALGNSLNQMGVRQVTGDLIIVGNFYMNYEESPLKAGELLREGLDVRRWQSEAAFQHGTLPAGTPKPQVAIAGQVRVAQGGIADAQPLLRHQSLTLAQILKQLNIYSNNPMAEMLAQNLGGATQVAQKAAEGAGVPREEILLQNGSGLGEENKISPRAVCAMFAAIQRELEPQGLNVADLFPISGRDVGTLIDRKIPATSAVKTGTLWNVSTLAGAIPTRDRGLVWFAILNRGEDLDQFRDQQDQLLQSLIQQWGPASTLPLPLQPTAPKDDPSARLGDSRRNQPISSEVADAKMSS